jgi:uncharacterized membrane protein
MNLFDILLFTHIAGGAISLILGLIVLIIKKGNKRHKLIGNIYFYSMLFSAVSALPMSYLHPNLFLFIIGVFTSYMLLTGKRYLNMKSAADFGTLDWVYTIWVANSLTVDRTFVH